MAGKVMNNARRDKFAELWATGTLSATEAAVQAGYGNNRASAKTTAHILTKNDEVKAIVEDIKSQARAGAVVTLTDHLARLDEIGRGAERAGRHGAAVTAETQRGKASGLYAKVQTAEEKVASQAEVARALMELARDFPDFKEQMAKITL